MEGKGSEGGGVLTSLDINVACSIKLLDLFLGFAKLNI